MSLKPQVHIDEITSSRYDKRFIYLLISLLTFLFGALFIPPAFSMYLSTIILLQYTFAGLLLFRNHKRWFYRIIMVLAFILLLLEGLKLASASSRTMNLISEISYLLYFLIMTVEVFRQILLAKEIDFNMVAGSFCGFIMLAIIGSFLLAIIEVSSPGSFKGIREDDFNKTFQDLIYYSFVTILTIGYGDILPLSQTARKASMLLGILGYFYNIFVIGITISKFRAHDRRHDQKTKELEQEAEEKKQ